MYTRIVLGSLLLWPAAVQEVGATVGAGAQDAQSISRCSPESPSALVAFVDPNLEAAVRAALSAGETDELTCGRAAELTTLTATEAGIESLDGIQALTGLEELSLWGNGITDVGPLAGLTGLTRLVLGANSITDVGSLAGLTNLRRLQIRENDIGDVGALRDLTQLIDLDISHNDIPDISALSGLTRLTTLRVYFNPLTDIGAMSGMTELTELHIHDLPDLATIQPLVENPGLGRGDVVILFGSNVCSEASALKDKGVRVSGCTLETLHHWWWAILLGIGFAAFGARMLRRRNERRWAAWRDEAARSAGEGGSA